MGMHSFCSVCIKIEMLLNIFFINQKCEILTLPLGHWPQSSPWRMNWILVCPFLIVQQQSQGRIPQAPIARAIFYSFFLFIWNFIIETTFRENENHCINILFNILEIFQKFQICEYHQIWKFSNNANLR